MADGRIGNAGGAYGVECEDWRKADAGDDEIGGAVGGRGRKGLGDAFEVVNISLDDVEMSVDGRLGDFTLKE